jgi:hypothetical protein
MHLFLTEISPSNSTNGLQSRARKWLFALITFIFALSTLHWIISVVLTFRFLDSWSSAVTGCFGSDDAVSCFITEISDSKFLTLMNWLVMSNHILLINVSTALHRVPAEYPHLLRSIPRELTRLPKLNLVHYRRRRHRMAGLGPVF